jgi:acyl-CoA thioesterase-1
MSARWRALYICGFVVVAACTGACGDGEPSRTAVSTSRPNDGLPRSTTVEAPVVAAAARPRVVILGDSLTAGLGLDPEQAFPALIQERVDASSLDFEVVNAGVSGDTSAGGLRRLDWALDGAVQVLVVALGGNDGLRGLPPEDLRENLRTIIERAQSRGISVVLAGMEAPPNLGAEYTNAFRGVYRELAREYDLVLVPFLLDGVAGISDLNQRDGIHPNAEGARIIAGHVWAAVSPLLGGAASRAPRETASGS